EWFVDDNTMLYASASTGFRSGGFNRFEDDPATPENEVVFDPETIDAFEIGFKLNGLLDNRLRLNGAVFYQTLEDQQVSTQISVAGTGQSGFFNAGETQISGVELDFMAVPSDAWYIAGTATYMNAEFEEYLASGFPADGGLVDLSGNKVARAPEWKVTLNSGYTLDLGSKGSLTPSVNLVWSDEFYSTFFNTSIDRVDSYAKLDLRLAWQSSDQHWSAEAFVENVTEEEVIGYGVFGGTEAFFANFEPPRMYGLRVSYSH
ncbi:MAG: TonB-dependent receptor, partial [Pseudomonadales bacterium]